MEVVVPFAVAEPKTRLAPVLDAEERSRFARAMLEDVVAAIRTTGREPTVLATASVDVDAPVVVDDSPLSEAVNAVLSTEVVGPDQDELAVMMADLALTTPAAVDRLFETAGDVVIVPGRGGGTNALVVRHPDFRVDYHDCSYLDHRRVANRIDADLGVVDSYHLSTDVDEPADLVEVWLHGGERSRQFLADAGFALDPTEGRVALERPVQHSGPEA